VITLAEYVGIHANSPDWTLARTSNAIRLLQACDKLEVLMVADGVIFPVNPKTHTQVSGEKYGGFRPQNCPEGAAHSSHKEGLAVDRYDPQNAIDNWLVLNQQSLVDCSIYIEHPIATEGWSHWSIFPPKSGHHIFYP
jgi:hypothetical protein